MARSSSKGYYIDAKLAKKVIKVKEAGGNQKIKTWARASTITPEMIGLNFDVHNGKTFTAIRIVEDMVGHRLGEFVATRKFIKHGGKIQKEAEQAAAGKAVAATAAAVAK